MSDGEIAVVTAEAVDVFDSSGKKIEKKADEVEIDELKSDKGRFPHYMLKEIYEQADVFKRIVAEYVDAESKSILLPKFSFDLGAVDFMTIVACGTSYHAGCVAKYFIEDLAGVFVNVDIASEFRYRTNPLGRNGLALFISQSGETADTIAALEYCKGARQKIVSIVNVAQSTIASESDIVLKTPAGVEVGVASTKALTAQVSLLYLFAIETAFRNGSMDAARYHELVGEFINAGRVLSESLSPASVDAVKKIARAFAAEADYLIYTGRDILFPLVLEGALKVEEVSYIPALGVASGELKHGPIALIGDNMFVVALNNSRLLFDKNASSIEEIAARNGRVVLVGDKESHERLKGKAYAFIPTAAADTKFEILLSQIIPIQLLAYFVSVEKGLDVDKPRNLAKSVTVE
jgi:glucosamine--fructose-6-phosphate aminotransferase (isomerizing)